MKPLRMSLIAGALAALAGTAMASSGSLVEFKPQVMPVVVQVNAQGKVTEVLPSRPLPPRVSRLLVDQLDAWIVRPADVKGHPVDSRFIVEVAMHAKPRKDGKYDASFVYVKSLPMPFGGAVHWNVINGGLELALVSDAMSPGGRAATEMMTFQQFRKPFTPRERPASSPTSIQPAVHAASPIAPPSSPPVLRATSSTRNPSTPHTEIP